ncbi:MAG TPA: ammonium transporter, partial [Methanomicrobiales archaeon]|nr:ammonium transporter [Methanomicrobiales archaeon]
GLLAGNPGQFLAQVVAALAAVAYAFVVTFILAKVVDKTIGLRVTDDEEYVGLDISQHGERV